MIAMRQVDAVHEERAEVRRQRDLGDGVDAVDAVDTEGGGDGGKDPDARVRGGEPAVQKTQDARDFLVARHRVRDADAGVEARERRADEREQDGQAEDDGDGRTGPAEDRVDHVGQHRADRGRVDRGSRIAGDLRAGGGLGGDGLGADREVGGEVLGHVGDERLDGEADEHAALDVLVGVDRLGAERGDRLEADEEQDGDRRLIEDVQKLCGVKTDRARWRCS